MHFRYWVCFVSQAQYGPNKGTMALPKHTENPSLVITYDQLYNQSYHNNNQPIPEQHSYEKKKKPSIN